MKLRVLGCSGGQVPGRKLSCFLVDDSLLLDAGSVTSALSLRAQESIKDVLITHIHLDHVLSLGMLADNLYGKCTTSINLWGTSEIIEGLKNYFFNDHIWPDFTRLTDHSQCVPVMRLCEMLPGERTAVGNHVVTPVRVNHVIPTLAYFLESRDQILLHIGDTAGTEEVWTDAQSTTGLCAIVVETSFPNRLQDIADSSLHLTPQGLARELKKLGNKDVPILVTHLKPAFRKEIIAEIKNLNDPRLRILRDGDVFNF